MSKRHLLLFDPNKQINRNFLEIVKNGWQIHHAENYAQLEKFVQQYPFYVGLSTIENPTRLRENQITSQKQHVTPPETHITSNEGHITSHGEHITSHGEHITSNGGHIISPKKHVIPRLVSSVIPRLDRGIQKNKFSQANKEVIAVFSEYPKIQWIVLVASDCLQSPDLVEQFSPWIYDYHTLPIDNNRLLLTLGHAYGMAKILQNNVVPYDVNNYHKMVGNSVAIKKVFHKIGKAAGVDAPVLITGESGTGKELIANAIHKQSLRVKGPFMVVNCAALPENLIQSELFGHEKGSFTGALQKKIGAFEAANKGTVFLDELGELSLDMQVNLLRFLQENTIKRIGSNEDIKVDVRVIAATNIDLFKAVQTGVFREDFYYRINVLHIETPSLRERKEDIELLAKYFFEKFDKEKHGKLTGFSAAALEVIKQHQWPGNIREMINRIRSAMIMSENNFLTPEDLKLERRLQSSRHTMLLSDVRELAERKAIYAALSRNQNNITITAKELGISRITLYRLMGKLDIQKEFRK